jgi:hypothetical protein
MSIDMTQLEVVINSIINMNKKMQSMETKFQTKVDSLEEENRQLYKRIEKLSETNARNEMEKEDKNAFINKLSRGVKKISRVVKKNEDYITTLFENVERRDDMNETNDVNIKSLFQNCELYENQIAILFKCNNNQELRMDELILNNKIMVDDINCAFKNMENNYKCRQEDNETNNKDIEENIELLFKNDKMNENKIKKLFNKCELYQKQIEILFDNDK